MATFLTLCQDLRREAGISGSGPTSVVSQSGENARIVNWVNAAWRDIQRKHQEWLWMRAEYSFATTPDDYDYSAAEAGIASRFRRWELNAARVYQTSLGVSDQVPLIYMPYEYFRDIYLTGTQTAGRPVCFTVGPGLKLLIGPKPNASYTISGEYYRGVQTLAVDADIPELPEDFHDMIWQGALIKYAFYESAPEVLGSAKGAYRQLMFQLEQNQLPDMIWPEPLL